MTKSAKFASVSVWLCLWLFCLLLLPSRAAAQVTTGTVSGVVRDASGAVVPHATVVLTNLENKSQRKVTSNTSGDFTIASVPNGLQYQVKVSMAGFESWESQPFPLRPGDQVSFTDVKLVVGSVEAQVTVEATESQQLKPLDTPERSDVITSADLQTLAIEGRDATELIRFLPGFNLVSPGLNNQAPNDSVVGVNGASTGSYSSNGTGVTGIATILDGVSLTDITSNSGTTQTINAEMVSEVKVSSSNFAAEFAHGPTIISGTTRYGGSAFHGSGYLYARDTVLNANDWFNNNLRVSRPDGRYLYPGGTIGGPLYIPHTRFGRNNTKLNFFAGYEYYNQLFSPQTLTAWVPTMAERAGDFSLASLNAQLCGARPDGLTNPNAIQTMCNAENYLPTGGTVVNGNLVGQGNASGIALLNWLALPNADPFTNVSGYNYIQAVQQQQNGSMFHARLDYSISDSNKISATYGLQRQTTQEPVSFGYIPTDSALYPGGVSSGDISNIVSVDYVHVFTSNLTNEVNAAVSILSRPGNEGNPSAVGRFTMNGYNCTNPSLRATGSCGSQGKGNFNYLGEYKNAGDYSVPAMADYSELGYSSVLMPGGFYNNQIHLKTEVPDFQDAVTYVRGHHALKAGIYYEKGIYNGTGSFGAYPQGQYTFNPQTAYYDYNGNVSGQAQFQGCINPSPLGASRNSGAAYLGACMTPSALMYLGYADSYTQSNFTPIVDMQYTTLAGFVNDNWRLSGKRFHSVTLQLGLRFEHLGPWVDRHNNGLATFSPQLYNQQCVGRNCGSTNDPGLTWHGIASNTSNTVNNPTMVFVSPRLGLSWDILGSGKTVLRGGWGIYRHEEEFQPYALAASTAQGYKNTYQAYTQLSFDAVDLQSPTNPPDFSAYTISPYDTQRPVYYEYNGAISQRLDWSHFDRFKVQSLVEVAYVGNTSVSESSYNNQAAGYNGVSDLDLIPAGFFFSPQGNANSVGADGSVSSSYDSIGSLSTPQIDYFRTYPFYQHIYQLKHSYYSNYNSLQTSWNGRIGPVQFGANYTFSKELAVAASYNNVVADPLDLRNEYNPVPYDRSHVFNAHYLIDFGKRYHGESRWLSGLANGWQISGISTVQGGPPLASLEGENFGFGYGSINPVQVSLAQQESKEAESTCETKYGIPPDKNGNHYCVNNVNPIVWLGTPDYQLMPTLKCNPASGLKTGQFINPSCFGIPLPGGPATGQYATSTNPSGQGQYRLPYIHGPGYMDHDLTILKNFGFERGRNLQIRMAGFNFLNNPQTSFNNSDTSNLQLSFQNATAGQAIPLTSLTHQNFGTANVKYGSRRIELSAKYTF
jgi:hypothetical protein